MLDIGTGHGAVALAASPFLDRVVGSDIDDRNLEFARLNSDLNDVRNVEFVRSDLFASIEGKFDLIVSNPPQAVAACGDPSTGFHDHGGFMGQELVEGILEGAWSRLTERGALVLSLSSPVMADGALVERQLRRHFADRPARIVIKHIVHDYNVKRHAFYREHGIRSFLRCLVTVRKSTHFEIERVDVQPAALMASRIRVALLRRLAPFATAAERGTPTARTADRGPVAVTEPVSSSRDSRLPQRAG
jgi:tRNA G10  N-methylase Trm11